MKQPLNPILRLLGGVLLILTFWIFVTVLIAQMAGPDLITAEGEGDTPFTALMLFLTITGLGLGTIIAARVTFNWTFFDLFGPPAGLRLFAPRALAVSGLFSALALVLAFAEGGLTRQLSLTLWLSYLPVALAALLIQTLAEELTFRAYLVKGLRQTGLGVLAAILVSSVLFALLHFNPKATLSGHVFGFLIIFAIAATAADLTLRSGSIVPAWMIHLTNNIVAGLLIAPEGHLSGFSLWTTPSSSIIEIPPMAAALEILRILLIWYFIRRGIPKPQ